MATVLTGDTRSRARVAGNLSGRAAAGGHWWALGQWALGLRDLGVRTTLTDNGPEATAAPTAAEDLGLAGALHHVSHTPKYSPPIGPARLETDLALRVMGDLGDAAPTSPGRSIFLDIDPGYPQMWRELGLADMFEGHDRFVTIGENIGRPDCAIPDCGLEWVTTPPPVVLDAWPPTPGGESFTTVATWRNPYGTVDWNGITYGSRVHEFRKFLELPRLVDADFELALDIDAAEVDDLALLDRNGWRLVDPRLVAGTPDSYRSYIQASKAEICIAQNMYVATRSGWISDRSLCYLASGKPVLAQDTGFSDNYPVGEGLIAFSTLDEAASGVEEIERNYERHSRAAREFADEFFDSRKVLTRLLDRLEISRPVQAR